MTAPQIGNAGVNAEDAESVDGAARRRLRRARRELSPSSSNWRAKRRSTRTSQQHGIVGIAGVDTRALTRHLRDTARRTARSAARTSPTLVRPRARGAADGRARPRRATSAPKRAVRLGTRRSGAWQLQAPSATAATLHVVAIDFGVKQNILRCLVDARLQGHRRARDDQRRRHPRASARTASSSRTARATPPPSTTRHRRRCASCSARSRSSASASATSSSRSRSAARPTS